MRKETRCHHIGYSLRLTARVLLYAPSHRQDSTYHRLYYTSRGARAGTRNSSMGSQTKIKRSNNLLLTELLSDRLEPVQRVELMVLVQQLEDVRKTHRETVVGERCPDFVLPTHLLLAGDGMLHPVDRQRREDDEEIPQMHVLRIPELGRKHVDQHLEILGAFCEIFSKISDDVVEDPSCILALGRKSLLLAQLLEADDVLQVRDEPDRVAAAVEASGSNHPDVAHGVADLRDERSELVEVAVAVRGHAQLADALVELVGALERVLLVGLHVVLAEELPVLDEARLDVLVVHELGEDEELLPQELVREVDGGVHDADAVRSDRVGDVPNVDRVQVFVVTRSFHKYL